MGMTKADLQRKKAIRDEHFVPADDEQAAALQYAEQMHALARFKGDDEEIAKAKAKLDEVQAAVRTEGVSFVFIGLGRKRFEELMREHPPTPEQQKETQATFNPDTFYAAMLAETVEGDLTAEDWQEVFLDGENWGVGEVAEIRQKAMDVNTASRIGSTLGN